MKKNTIIGFIPETKKTPKKEDNKLEKGKVTGTPKKEDNKLEKGKVTGTPKKEDK